MFYAVFSWLRKSFFKLISILVRFSLRSALVVVSMPNSRAMKLSVCTATSSDFFRVLPMHSRLSAPPTMESTRKKSEPTRLLMSYAMPLIRQTLKKVSSCVDFSGSCITIGTYTKNLPVKDDKYNIICGLNKCTVTK